MNQRTLFGGLITKAVVSLMRNVGLGDPGLYRWFGTSESTAGKLVTVDTALNLATVWGCVRLIAETIASMSLGIYERQGGRKEPAPDHPLYLLLHDQPNADMTATEFWEAMVACLLLWGNAYAEKAVVYGRVVSLTPILPERVAPRRRDTGAIFYEVMQDGRRREVPEELMFHLKGFSLDGLLGLSPIGQARHTLGLAMAADEAAGSLFRNGMRIGGAMVAPSYLSDPQRAQAKVMLEQYRGAVAAGRTPILEGGWKFEAVTMPPQEAELLATRQFSVEEICRWYRVPPAMVGHTERVTTWGTGLEQMNLGFLTYTLRPYLTRIEQAVKKSLIAPAERGRVFAEFNLESLLRADSQGRAALYSTFAQNGIMTRNEIRALENRPPMEGGDELTAQSNLVPLHRLGISDQQQRPGQPDQQSRQGATTR
jgi:HK97 family phage portal protein